VNVEKRASGKFGHASVKNRYLFTYQSYGGDLLFRREAICAGMVVELGRTEDAMGKKRQLRRRRGGKHQAPGLVDSLIGMFMKMVTIGEIKPTVGHLIRLIELREELGPTKVVARWVH
jgi:hypothetical protein